MEKKQKFSHHFDNYQQQVQAEKLGMWLFLATEILMFGGLFVAYTIYHAEYPKIFKAGAEFLDWKKGAVNTIVLLLSSWTMVMSIYFAQRDQIKKCQQMLIATLSCGLVFMIIKYLEYTHKFHDGIFPGSYFSYSGEGFVEGLPLYFSFYYVMTGLHAIHVFIGLVLISWMLFKTFKKQLGSHHFMPLEYVGLFWHLIDLIWIFLFPLLYLVE